MAGMNASPMPIPRSTIVPSQPGDRGVRADEGERDRGERRDDHAGERERAAAEAVGQAPGERQHEDHPEAHAGSSRSPVSKALSPRTCCQ